jgi:hypothetical protein
MASATHLIIDEVSMISADFFTKLEIVVRCVRQNGRPFGGLTLILTGDFLQLPPIFRGAPGDAKFCFESPAWHSSIHQSIELRQVFRQSDPVFINILNQIRLGRCDAASVTTLVSACGSSALKREFAIPDTNQQPQLESIVRTKLSPFNQFVDSNNAAELEKLSGESHSFRRQTNLLRGPNSADAELIRVTEDKCNAPQVLELKIGAQVVLLRNLNVEKQLVNGARGRVVSFVSNADAGDRQVCWHLLWFFVQNNVDKVGFMAVSDVARGRIRERRHAGDACRVLGVGRRPRSTMRDRRERATDTAEAGVVSDHSQVSGHVAGRGADRSFGRVRMRHGVHCTESLSVDARTAADQTEGG